MPHPHCLFVSWFYIISVLPTMPHPHYLFVSCHDIYQYYHYATPSLGLFKGDFLNRIKGQINYLSSVLPQIKGQIKYLCSSLIFYQIKGRIKDLGSKLIQIKVHVKY